MPHPSRVPVFPARVGYHAPVPTFSRNKYAAKPRPNLTRCHPERSVFQRSRRTCFCLLFCIRPWLQPCRNHPPVFREIKVAAKPRSNLPVYDLNATGKTSGRKVHTMNESGFDPEKLRPAEYICEPDPRNTNIVWPDPATGALRPAKASDLHDAVAAFSLHAGVPEDIAQHFETVKNRTCTRGSFTASSQWRNSRASRVLNSLCASGWRTRLEQGESRKSTRGCNA